MVNTTGSSALASSQDAVLRAARDLVQGHALSLSKHGNISARVAGADQFVLTGGGSLDRLERHDLALLDLDGHVIEGALSAASSEIIQMHAAVYRKRPDVGAVIHTHSPHVTAYAIANKPLQPVYEAMIRFDITDPVPVADYGPRGSERSVQNILDVIGPKTKAVLLANHGLLVFDRDIESAVHLVYILEEAAEFTMKADLLGGAKPIPAELIGEALQRRDAFAEAGGNEG